MALTNRTVAPAQRGQGVIITLNGTDSAGLASITVGATATVASSSKTGKVISVDTYGHTFKVIPSLPDGKFDSTSTPGQLAVADTITIS